MGESGQHAATDLDRFDRLWWLPANGIGNGIDDTAWVPLVDVRGEFLALSLLALLLDERVPGYTAPVRRAGAALRPRSRRADGPAPPWRLWVGASARGTGENLLLRVLPAITRKYGDAVLA